MKKWVVIFFSFLVTGVNAQVVNRNILQNKYSLEAIGSSLVPLNQYAPFPKSVEQWRAQVPDLVLKHMVKQAEAVLNFKFDAISASVSLNYVRTGDRTEHANISFTKRAVLLKLILAESIEHKGRFMESILNGIWSICEESFWGVPAHIANTGLPDTDQPVVELFSAETAALFGLADYFLGEDLDKVNKLFRKRMYSETNKRLFIPMLQNGSKYGWMSTTKPVNNWNPWIMSNWIMATLLLEKDNTRRTQMVHGAMKGLDSYLNSLGEEGGCDEGPSYWFAAGASTFDCLELLSGATQGGVNIFQDPLIKKMGAYIYKTHIGGKYFVNFSDADPQLIPDGIMIYRFGNALQDSLMMQMGAWAFTTYNKQLYTTKSNSENFYKPRYVQNILSFKQMPSNQYHYDQPKEVWVNDVQVMTARVDSGFYLASHAGHNDESHNHNDVGDFIVYANEEPIIVDAGRGNYTARTFSSHRYELWFTQSQYHNLPIINGKGQLAGRSYRATEVHNNFSSNESQLAMNIAAAYDTTAGIYAWNRKVTLNKQINQVKVEDHYTFKNKSNSIQQVFMTVCAVDTTTLGKLILTTPTHHSYALHYNAKKYTLQLEYPSMEGPEYSSFKTKWNGQPVVRILFTNSNAGQKGSSLFTIEKK